MEAAEETKLTQR